MTIKGKPVFSWPPKATFIKLEGYAVPERFTMEWHNAGESPEPDLRMAFRVQGGRVECEAVEVRAHETGREVRYSDMRAIAVETWMERAVMAVAAPIVSDDGKTMEIKFLGAFFDPENRAPAKALTRSRRRVSPATLRQVAEAYRSSDRPVEAVQDLMEVERRAAQLWIKRARENVDAETGKPYLEGRKDGQ